MARVLINILIVLLALLFFSFLGAVSFPGLPSTNSSLENYVRAFLLLIVPGITMGVIGHFLGRGIRSIKNSFEALGLTYVSAFIIGSILALLSLLNFGYSVHLRPPRLKREGFLLRSTRFRGSGNDHRLWC